MRTSDAPRCRWRLRCLRSRKRHDPIAFALYPLLRHNASLHAPVAWRPHRGCVTGRSVMSSDRHWTWKLPFIVSAFLTFSAVIAYQPLPAPKGARDPLQDSRDRSFLRFVDTSTEAVTLPTDTTLRNKLDAARDYMKAGDWDQSVRLLQTVLHAGEDSFFRQTYTDGSGRPAERWASTRAEAERLVAGLPDDGRKMYEVSYNGVARKLFSDARAANDLAALDVVVRRFQKTSAGTEALTLLALLHLDRGRIDLAALSFRRLPQANP